MDIQHRSTRSIIINSGCIVRSFFLENEGPIELYYNILPVIGFPFSVGAPPTLSSVFFFGLMKSCMRPGCRDLLARPDWDITVRFQFRPFFHPLPGQQFTTRSPCFTSSSDCQCRSTVCLLKLTTNFNFSSQIFPLYLDELFPLHFTSILAMVRALL